MKFMKKSATKNMYYIRLYQYFFLQNWEYFKFYIIKSQKNTY